MFLFSTNYSDLKFFYLYVLVFCLYKSMAHISNTGFVSIVFVFSLHSTLMKLPLRSYPRLNSLIIKGGSHYTRSSLLPQV